jgi:hypothetical protein
MAKSLTGMVRGADSESLVPAQGVKKSTPKTAPVTREPITYPTLEELHAAMPKKERAALKAELARKTAAQEVMHKINLVLSTCDPVPGSFEYFKRASVAFGGTDVPTLTTVYLDLCTASGTTADGMEWDPMSEYKAKRGNFYAYCKFMERYTVWAHKASRPTVKKSTKKKGKV